VVDSSHVRDLKGEPYGPSPVARGRAGSKHHLITDGRGTPLAVPLTAATATTSPNCCPCSTRSRRSATASVVPGASPTSDSLFADRGNDDDIRDQVREGGIVPAIARRGTRHGTGLCSYRWVRIRERTAQWELPRQSTDS
jgi:hypothetical protein